MKHLLTWLFAASVAFAPLASTAAPSPRPSSSPKPPEVVPESVPDAVTQHTIAIDGKTIDYTARVGTITLRNDREQPTARMSYVAYTVGNDPRRPVTFLYNGGPGSSTMWLLMGSVGPEHVATVGDRLAGSPPYHWADNADSILDVTDLVFVDMPNTGFGRIIGAGKPKDFFGVDEDANAFAQFIERYVTRFGRWNSPKFLFGESYGTPRSARLSSVLFDRGIGLNGIVLQSMILNFHLDWLDNYPYVSEAVGGSDRGYVLYLPTLAATAWYHNVVPHRGSLADFIQSVKHYALAEYTYDLAAGDTMSASQLRAAAQRLHQYIGLPVQYLVNSRLRVPYGRFMAALLRDQGKVVGRLDARYAQYTIDPEQEEAPNDAADSAMDAPYTSAVNQYLRESLRYNPPILYNRDTYALIEREGQPSWKAEEGDINTAPDLAQTMTDNPQMKVFAAAGIYDMATPFFAAQYTMQHLNLPAALQANITYGFYESGHMIYLNQSALDKYHRDLEAWYRSALHD